MCEEDFFRDMEAFGEALKILRCRRVLTQEVLAKQAGISKKYLVELEKGMHSVGLEITLRLCKALGVNRFELFVLAWGSDYIKYVEQWQRPKVNTRTKPNNEGRIAANDGKPLRHNSKIREENLTKRLLGGDNSGIIRVRYRLEIANF